MYIGEESECEEITIGGWEEVTKTVMATNT